MTHPTGPFIRLRDRGESPDWATKVADILIDARLQDEAEAEAKAEAAALAKFEAEAKAKEEAEARAKAQSEAVVLSDKAVADANANRHLDEMEDRMLAEQEAVEARRKAVQLAEQAKPVLQMSPDVLPNHPGDKDLITAITLAYGVSYGTACDWVMETAERLKVAA